MMLDARIAELEAKAEKLKTKRNKANPLMPDSERDALRDALEASVHALARLILIIEEQVEETASGNVLVKLTQPIPTKGGGERATLSVRPILVRDIRKARSTDGPEVSEAFADVLVEPKGLFDELRCERDYLAVIEGVNVQLGKYQGGGQPHSRD